MDLAEFYKFSHFVIQAGTAYALLISLIELLQARHWTEVEPLFYLGLVIASFQLRKGLVATGLMVEHPFWVTGLAATIFALGPVVLLMFRRMSDGEIGGKLPALWHLAPAVIILAVNLLRMAYDLQWFFNDMRRSFSLFGIDWIHSVLILAALHLSAYIIYVYLAYTKFKRAYEINMEQAIRSPRQFNSILILALMTVLASYVGFTIREKIIMHLSGWMVTAITIQLLVYRFQYPDFFQNMVKVVRSQKYERTKLTGIDVPKILKRIEQILGVEKAYVDGELRIQDLAEELRVSTHQLSRIINENHKTNFYDLVNFYRIEETKRLLAESNTSVIEILFQVGFNSKSTFNAQFRKFTGTTPSRFRESAKTRS